MTTTRTTIESGVFSGVTVKAGDKVGFTYNGGSHPGDYRTVEVTEVVEHAKPGRRMWSSDTEPMISGVDTDIEEPRNFTQSSISGLELLNEEPLDVVDPALNETVDMEQPAQPAVPSKEHSVERTKPTNESRVNFADARSKIAEKLYHMSGDQLATIYGEVCGGDEVDTVEFDSTTGDIIMQETVQETERLLRIRTSTIVKVMAVDDDAATAKIEEVLARQDTTVVIDPALGTVVEPTDMTVEAVAG